MKIAVISAGASNPSSTKKLADRLHHAVAKRVPDAEFVDVDVRNIGHSLLNATTSGMKDEAVTQALDAVASADGLIAVTPVFNGAYSGLFKLFFDILDEGALRSVPVVLAATGGTARHSLAIDQTMVPLFFYLRAQIITTSVFAATDDWADPTFLDKRVAQAAQQLVSALSDLGGATLQSEPEGTWAGRAGTQQEASESGNQPQIRQHQRRVAPDDDFTVPEGIADLLAQVSDEVTHLS